MEVWDGQIPIPSVIPMAPSSSWSGATFFGADSGAVKVQRKEPAQSGLAKRVLLRPLQLTLKIPGTATVLQAASPGALGSMVRKLQSTKLHCDSSDSI